MDGIDVFTVEAGEIQDLRLLDTLKVVQELGVGSAAGSTAG